jgi:putative proteasome-type protease
MTFCLGMRVKDGLIGLADTRITSGNEMTTARKIAVYRRDQHTMFLMTSGLRSIRDKVLTYFEQVHDSREEPFPHLYQAVNAVAEQMRIVAQEDRAALAESGVPFDMHILVGGKMPADATHRLYMIYPQGNWIEIGEGTPYQIIGVGGYGKPILDRTLQYSDELRFALKVGFLAFDSTRISASNVDYPLDVIVFRVNPFSLRVHRYVKQDLQQLSENWQSRLRESVQSFPEDWVDAAFKDL